MTRTRIIAAALLLALGAPAFAAFGGADKGTSGAQFLKLGVGARALGMGEAHAAVADDASALYWNPAGLLMIEKNSAVFMHAFHLDGVSYDYLAYGRALSEETVLAGSVQHLSAGVIEETDSSGIGTGADFTPRDLAFSFGLSREVERFAFGGVLKIINTQIIRGGRTAAVDFGALSPGYFDGSLRAAFAVQNLGGSVTLDKESDPLPLNIRMGGALWIYEGWVAALDLNLPRDNGPYVSAGTEYRLSQGHDATFLARAGVNSRVMGDVDGLAWLSFGLGAVYKRYSLDYALVPAGSLGITHRLSISTRW